MKYLILVLIIFGSGCKLNPFTSPDCVIVQKSEHTVEVINGKLAFISYPEIKTCKEE